MFFKFEVGKVVYVLVVFFLFREVYFGIYVIVILFCFVLIVVLGINRKVNKILFLDLEEFLNMERVM